MEDLHKINPDDIKEFGVSTFSVNNRMTAFVLTFIIFVSGLMAYIGMPSEAFPEVVIPQVYVGTPYPGNSPVDMEKLITRPIEKEINGITGVDVITSTSVQGYSTIQVEFDFSVSTEEALRKVKDKVDVAKSDADFPKDLPADPNVFELNFSELMPIRNINLSGPFTIEQLNEYAEYLEDEIEDLPEITKVEIRGVDDKEVAVRLNMQKMEALNLSFGDVAGAITNENITISGGDLLVDGYRRNVRVVGEFSSAEEIGNIIVKHENADVVYLKNIAEVSFGEVEKESFARQRGEPVVMLDVMKRSGENLIIASDKIDALIEKAKEEVFPDGLHITITGDQSDQTKTQLSDLENSIILGVLLVVVVLMFFLGLRNALFVGIAIPLSMFMSFFILNSMGVTLNTMVLFALVLALGMLVDNGIVVVENIYRMMDEGMDPVTAAKKGAGEVAVAIIASTATTLAAFVPLAFWPGIMGEFMKYLPITLIIVLGSSLFVALVINPALTSKFMKLEEEAMKVKKWRNIGIVLTLAGLFIGYLAESFMPNMGLRAIGNLMIITALIILSYMYFVVPMTVRFQTKFLPRLEKRYERMLKYALRGRNAYLFFFGSVGLLIFSFMLLGVSQPKVLFFPENQPRQALVYIELPIGTDILETDKICRQIEDQVFEIVDNYTYPIYENGDTIEYNYMVESVIAQVGEGTSDPNQGPSMAQTPNKAKITVAFRPFADRVDENHIPVRSSDVLQTIREAISDYPGVNIAVDKDKNGPDSKPPINIEINGEDYGQLLETAENMRRFINERGIKGIEELQIDVQSGKPEMPIEIDRVKARTLGISTAQIGDALRTALFGKEVSRFKDGEDDYPINLRFSDNFRYNIDDLLNQRITFRDPASGRIKQVPISAVAQPQLASTFSAVKRKDLDRVITIYSNTEEGANGNEVVAKIQAALSGYETPRGVNFKFTGEQEEMAEQMAFLSKALMAAVFLIFLILVAQFNSASTPFIILTTVVLSLVGVLLGLIIFNMEFVIMMTMIGIISLAGIVVNNAIVLIDYTKQLMDRRRAILKLRDNELLPREELYLMIVEAGKTRLRPVLLTAITTILGLLPLATGMNINFITLVTQSDPQIYFGGDNVIFWGPMSWTVIFGLTFATFLTLIVVPVMFYLMERGKRRFSRVKSPEDLADLQLEE
ncbi:efflux RND transporter permease subunit [Phaeocystidibacter marisrubri]|uniref:Efflux RND transporter permease subunit n=1 Tax=Phaeocystidibacter marisrubri TaxID=1577780 RepID=A0A6L3ZFX9_9FLAO|nr:efflux RND transporter permease subunit [Phaeocystidibacter marisrubri]KAB2816352.1 efflux RND transporter permease subunit [Phaeocystidibacter marisrubri]GGH68596.1 copper transporter [Phaeocystidibacter marisrubri]